MAASAAPPSAHVVALAAAATRERQLLYRPTRRNEGPEKMVAAGGRLSGTGSNDGGHVGSSGRQAAAVFATSVEQSSISRGSHCRGGHRGGAATATVATMAVADGCFSGGHRSGIGSHAGLGGGNVKAADWGCGSDDGSRGRCGQMGASGEREAMTADDSGADHLSARPGVWRRRLRQLRKGQQHPPSYAAAPTCS